MKSPLRLLLALLTFSVVTWSPAWGACPSELPPASTWDQIPPKVRAPTAGEDEATNALVRAARALYEQGRMQEALRQYADVLSRDSATFGPDHLFTSTSHLNVAYAALDADDLVTARRHAEAALRIRRGQPARDNAHTVVLLAMLGNIASREARDREGVSLLSQAVIVGEACLPTNDERVLVALNDLAAAQDRAGDFASAEGLYWRALDGWRSVGRLDCSRAGSDCRPARIVMQNLSRNLSAQGYFDAAGDVLETARAATIRGVGARSRERAAIEIAIGDACERGTKCFTPVTRYGEGVSILEAIGETNSLQYAAALYKLGSSIESRTTMSAQGARESYLKALAVINSLSPLPEGLRANVMTALARTGLATDPSTALEQVREAARWRDPRALASTLLAARRADAGGSIASDRSFVLARALWSTGARQGTAASEVLSALQATMSSSADQALRRGAAFSSNVVPAALLSAFVDAGQRLDQADQAISRLSFDGARVDDQRRVEMAKRATVVRELDSLEAELRRRSPRFIQLLQNEPLTLAQLQSRTGPDASLLQNDEALVLLTPGMMAMPSGQRRGFVFVLTKDQAAWAELGLEPDALANEIAAMRAMLDRGGATRGPQTAPMGPGGFDRARAFRLYQALFGDPNVASILAGKEKWLVAPQGVLLSLPLAALVTAAPDGGSAGDADPEVLRATAWLGLQKTLSILPAVSSLATLRRDTPRGPRVNAVSFFGVGDPAFEGAPANDRASNDAVAVFRRGRADLDAVRQLPRLENALSEIRALSRLMDANDRDVLIGPRASEKSLRNASARLSQARVVAFATHGLVAGDLAGSLAEPALALTPPTANETLPDNPAVASLDDGLLTASEVALLPLSADWVILSACNTAAGNGTAEGLSGLARSFFYAGARTLLVSHWRVRDDVAARLTTRAVEVARDERVSNAEALRKAMSEVVRDPSQDASGRSLAHPSAWAPFLLVGVSGPEDKPN